MRSLSSLALMGAVACGGGEAESTGPVTPPKASSAASTTAASATATATTKTEEPAEPPKPTLADMHKKVSANSLAGWSARDPKKLLEDYAEGAVMGSPTAKGWEEIKATESEKRLAALFTAAPDIKFAVARGFTKDNVGVTEWVMTGTNTGEMMGEKATGKKFGYRGVTVVWLDKANGKVTRENVYMDESTLLGQLGKGDKNMKVRAVEELPSAPAEMIVAKEGEDTAKNEAAVKAFYATFEKKDDKAYTAMITDDFLHADYSRPADVKGKDAMKKDFGEFVKAFPDVKINAKNVWGIGDWVIVEGDMTATMKGNLGPMKATNKSATTHYLDLFKLKDGKVASVATYSNGLEFAVAYGMMKPPAPPKDAKPADAKPAKK